MAPINDNRRRVDRLIHNLVHGKTIGNRLFFRYEESSTIITSLLGVTCSLSQLEVDGDPDNYFKAQMVIFGPVIESNLALSQLNRSYFHLRLETYQNDELNIPYEEYIDRATLKILLILIFNENHDCHDLAGNFF